MVRLAAGVMVAAGCLVGLAPVAVAQADSAPYKNCSQAREDGVCDIPEDSPYYQAKLDRDGDGIGCEC